MAVTRSSPRPLTAAVIGGGLGGRLSLDALRQSASFEAIAVADTNPSVRAELDHLYPDVQTFESHTELLDNVSPEVICVSTYPATHEEITLAALVTKPRGLLVEKPLGRSTSTGARILDAVRQAAVPLVVPHGLLVQATAREILERTRLGDIGDIELIEIRTTGWDIINAGIHWLNYCIQLLAPDRVDHVLTGAESSSRTYRDGTQVETTAVTYLETVGRVRVVMISGDQVKMPDGGVAAHFKIIGSTGRIDFSGFEEGYSIQSRHDPLGRRVQPTPLPGTGHQRHLDQLAKQIHKGKPDYGLAESSLAALELCEAAYLAFRHRCRVELPLRTFTAPDPNGWDPGMPYAGAGGGRDGRSL